MPCASAQLQVSHPSRTPQLPQPPPNCHSPTARAILVDTEPSTVAAAHAAAAATGSWQFSRAAAQALKGGSTAGNWAAGALQHGPSARASVIGMVRRQAERCDALGGLLIMQVRRAEAGGGGSIFASWRCRLRHAAIKPRMCPVLSCRAEPGRRLLWARQRARGGAARRVQRQPPALALHLVRARLPACLLLARRCSAHAALSR